MFQEAEEGVYKLTSSVYLPLQGRLVVGREDGSIIIVNASHSVMLQLLWGRHMICDDWSQHQVLHGHSGKVTCLLYPYHVDTRYDIAHLISGGVDFSVCLWDLYAGTLLFRFCVHAGEITQLLIPPKDCSVSLIVVFVPQEDLGSFPKRLKFLSGNLIKISRIHPSGGIYHLFIHMKFINRLF